ncbi:MAG TPA: hypothetical protein VNF74_06200 [Terriglobales bacterium]|nr:hypothetical protein [Terriglobales bacterium]
MSRHLVGAASMGLLLLGSLALDRSPAAGPQAQRLPLATLAGTSVRVSGGAVELDAAGRLRVPDGARIALDGTSAELDLVRGGSIHLCGPARMSLAAGGAQALLVSLERGALELRYASPVADSLLTPDYRITTVVPPDQLATVSASVGLEANGNLCVLNRGSALTVERLYDGVEQSVINGQGFEFPPSGAAQVAASCPCAAPPPGAVVSPPRSPAQGAGPLFPQQPALTVQAGAAPPPAAPAAAAPAPAPAPRHHNALVRFLRWLFGKK